MKLCLKNEDTICIKNCNINVVIDNKTYIYRKEEIAAAMIITSDLGPLYDDMCLAIRIDKDTAIFIMSGHPLYDTFLFDELKTIIDINYNNVIKAATCVENNEFIIYKKGKSNKPS